VVRNRAVLAVSIAACVPVAVVVAVIPFRTRIENTNVALGLVVVVLLASVLGGRWEGIVASVSSALSFDVFLTRPYNSLRITKSDDLQTTVLLAIIGVIAGELVERVRRSSARAASSESALKAAYDRAELTAGAENPGALLGLAARELTRLLELKSCQYVSGAIPKSMPELRHNFVRVPANLDRSARGLVALPVKVHGRLQGHFVMTLPELTVGTSLTADQRHAAVALADQVGVGLLRFREH
jgi:K+-sensing histidine kinase KdpD